MDEKLLNGKTAVVTGAGGGIGKAVVLCMIREGARVTALDADEKKVKQTAEEAKLAGGFALGYGADVRNSGRIQQIVNETIEKTGGLDILVNCAGIWGQHTGKYTDFIDSDEETWDWIIGVNLKGTMICTKAVLRQMINQRHGKIINIGSVAGVNGLPKMADYSASKGGIISFTKALAVETGQYNIQVNCVSPGSIDTHGGGPQTLLGRLGTAEETAELILFLASGNSSFITGQNYIIDGGRTLSTRW
jgi:NAD(P)-dependent dehydrogenase (short-subunit alcohol dehydrogenase family)